MLSYKTKYDHQVPILVLSVYVQIIFKYYVLFTIFLKRKAIIPKISLVF